MVLPLPGREGSIRPARRKKEGRMVTRFGHGIRLAIFFMKPCLLEIWEMGLAKGLVDIRTAGTCLTLDLHIVLRLRLLTAVLINSPRSSYIMMMFRKYYME